MNEITFSGTSYRRELYIKNLQLYKNVESQKEAKESKGWF